jgi:hypothetical protein
MAYALGWMPAGVDPERNRRAGMTTKNTADFFNRLLNQDTSRLLKNPDCRLLKKISEARRA